MRANSSGYFLNVTAPMYIKKAATHNLKAQLSPSSNQQQPMQTVSPVLHLCESTLPTVEATLTASGLGLWDWDLITDKTYYAPSWKQMLGYEVAEIVDNHTSFEKLVHPKDLPRVIKVLEDYLQGRTPVYEVEFRMLTKYGKWKWIFDTGKVFKWDSSGKPIRMTGTHKDITSEKEKEEILQLQTRQSKLMLAVSERIAFSSKLEVVLQTVVEEVREFFQADRTLIYRCRPNNSGVVAFESLGFGVQPLKGLDIAGKCFSGTDISDYQQGDINAIDNVITAPLNSNQLDSFNQFAVKASLVVPILLKTETENPSLTENRLWGMLLVHHCNHSYSWKELEIKALQLLRVQVAIAIKQEELAEQLQWSKAHNQEISLKQEVILEDYKQIKQQLLQNEKIAILGEHVAEVTNEIINPVNFIDKNLLFVSEYAEDFIRILELYQHSYPKPVEQITCQLEHIDLNWMKTDFVKLLWSMRAGSERIKEVVGAVKNYSQKDDNQKTAVNIHEGIESVLRILQHRLKEQPEKPRIQLIKEFGDLPLVECYPGELNQVFMNILTNAIDALEEKMKFDFSFLPQIKIRTEIVTSHLSLISCSENSGINQRPSAKQKVVIRISDNGKGILPHIQRHMFEAFFTTKLGGKGKGLGLSISQQIIVERHNGKLKCNSRLGEGTELLIEVNTPVRHFADIRKHASF
ncbi:MAG: PAS domain-containing protein [Scytonematopsis contorta HA4267-MV1]|nr:PAS domain-containing protein [Scytonematopsis contorta HA4267-MV1]